MSKPQMVLTVTWSPNAKRWIVTVNAVTVDGAVYKSSIAEDPYGSPLDEETALLCLSSVVAHLSGGWPW